MDGFINVTAFAILAALWFAPPPPLRLTSERG
jgi:hypothetical protein